MDISGHDAELRYVDTRLHNESLTLFSVHAFSLDLSPNELFRYMSSKPAKTSPSSSALQDLAIKLACSQLSDMSINQRLWPSSSSQLGIGATFQVESREAKGKKLVAVKHIKRDSADEEQFSYTAPTRERLDDVLLEVQVLLHLKTLQHPNIVEIVGFGWDEGPLPYLVLELADLGSLDKFLNEHELSWSQKELTMIQLASGLEMLHACEIIHGDIKLENVLVFSKEPYGFVAKLADFGFCLANTLGIEVYHGTSVFNPPEMCSGARTSLSNLDYSFEMADVYSYGLVAWEIVNDGGRFYSTSAIGIDPQHSNEALLFLSDLDSTKQELFPYAWKYVESLSLPETLASPLLKILEMSLRRDWGSRSEIREIREVMDLDEDYEPVIAIPLGKPCYSIFDICTAPLTVAVRSDLVECLQRGLDSVENEYRGSDAFNLSAFYALGFGVLRNDEISFRYLAIAAAVGYQPAMFYYRAFLDNGLLPLDTDGDSLSEEHPINQLPTSYLSIPQETRAQEQIRRAYKYWITQSVDNATIRGHQIAITGVTIDKLLATADIDKLHNLEVEIKIDGKFHYRPLLHHLARHDENLVADLLRKGAIGSSLGPNNETLLHVACECGSMKLVETLLELEPEMARRNTRDGVSPLHWLFMFENSDISTVAKHLVDLGAFPTRVGVKFLHELNLVFTGPAIHWAIMARNIHAVEALINLKVDLNADNYLPPDCLNYSPFAIDIATSLLMPEMVQLLASHGALLHNRKGDPTLASIDHVGDTIDPFRLWLYHGQNVELAAQQTIQVLLNYGASLEAPCNISEHIASPIENIVARTTCLDSVLKQFLGFGPGVTKETINIAAKSLRHDSFNNEKMIVLLEYCSNRLDSQSFLDGCVIALSSCVKDGTAAAARAILARLGAAAKKTIDEENLIHMAAESDDPEMIRLLEEHGGDIDLDADGTPAGTAAMYSKRKALNFLLSRGARLMSSPSAHTSTILHDIVWNTSSPYESEKTLEMVCDRFRDKVAPVVNAYDDRGLTVLHQAIIWGNIRNVSRLMLHLHADDRNVRDTDVSPLYLAALCKAYPPWVVLQQGKQVLIEYRKSMDAIIDYLQDTMNLPVPKSIVKVPEIMNAWRTPQHSLWGPNDQIGEWYMNVSYGDTSSDRVKWWGVQWRPQQPKTNGGDGKHD